MTGLKVAFSAETELGMCSELKPEMTNERMKEQCSFFCGHSSIPMLIGAEIYGVSGLTADNICSPPSGVLEYNPPLLSQCRSWSMAFRGIEQHTGKFIGALEEFKTAVLLYKAAVRKSVKETQKYMEGEEFSTVMRRASDKIDAAKKAFAERQSGGMRKAQAEMKNKMGALRAAVRVLSDTLHSKLDSIENFVQHCDKFYLGYGPQTEYMLDICAQGSAACFNENVSKHVSCCCAWSPLSKFGDKFAEASIPGISRFSPAGHVAGGGRFLQAQESETPLDICAHSWITSRDEVVRLQELLVAEDGKEVVEEYLQTMAKAYGREFCVYGDRRLLEEKLGVEMQLSHHPNPVVTMPCIMAIMVALAQLN